VAGGTGHPLSGLAGLLRRFEAISAGAEHLGQNGHIDPGSLALHLKYF
jgi:hypothetical protein